MPGVFVVCVDVCVRACVEVRSHEYTNFCVCLIVGYALREEDTHVDEQRRIHRRKYIRYCSYETKGRNTTVMKFCEIVVHDY